MNVVKLLDSFQLDQNAALDQKVRCIIAYNVPL